MAANDPQLIDPNAALQDQLDQNAATGTGTGTGTTTPTPTPSTAPTTGAATYVPQDTSISTRLNGLLNQNGPLIRQARQRGLETANARGLLNSNIAAGTAEAEAYKTALPIAAQESQQASAENIAHANIASNDREKATAAVVQMAKNYTDSFDTILNNPHIPADARDRYLTHIAALKDQNLNLVEQMYGISLDWGQGTGSNANDAANPPVTPAGSGQASGTSTAALELGPGVQPEGSLAGTAKPYPGGGRGPYGEPIVQLATGATGYYAKYTGKWVGIGVDQLNSGDSEAGPNDGGPGPGSEGNDAGSDASASA